VTTADAADSLVLGNTAGTSVGTLSITTGSLAITHDATVNNKAIITDGNTLSVGGTLTIASGGTINEGGATGSTASISGGSVINQGTINAAIKTGTFNLTSTSFDNQGTIKVSGTNDAVVIGTTGTTLTNEGTVDVLTSGNVFLQAQNFT